MFLQSIHQTQVRTRSNVSPSAFEIKQLASKEEKRAAFQVQFLHSTLKLVVITARFLLIESDFEIKKINF